MQYCIQPRAKSSLIDAVYTHQMMKKMHMMNTTSFHTLRVYQAVSSGMALSLPPVLILFLIRFLENNSVQFYSLVLKMKLEIMVCSLSKFIDLN